MTINGYNFIYANQSSDEYGIFMCDIGSINASSNDEASELITSTTPFTDRWHFHGLQKSAPLQFKITIARADGKFIDADFEEELKEWLCQDEFGWLQVDQEDMFGKFYFCIMTNVEKNDIARRTGGLTFQITCDSGRAWSDLKRQAYTSNGSLTFNFYNSAKYKKHVLNPTLIITPTSSGSISIKNNTTDQTVTINNCVANETITLDCDNEMAESSNGRVLVNDWNVEFLGMQKGANNITLTGNFKLTIEYRIPVRVGG